MTTTILLACGGGAKDAQADPRGVAEAIFNAAKSGQFTGLSNLIDADADNDSKMIAQAETDAKIQEEFKKYFSKGSVVAEPTVTGDKALVKILFGPDGTTAETFTMVRKNGKWYLTSF